MEEYKLWLNKAEDDLNWTKHNLKGSIWYGACFTANQSIEKSLKAFLLSKGAPSRKIHDLRALLEDCLIFDQEFEKLRDKILTVLPYYIETRYPLYEDIAVFTKKMAEEAYKYANEIFDFVQTKCA